MVECNLFSNLEYIHYAYLLLFVTDNFFESLCFYNMHHVEVNE